MSRVGPVSRSEPTGGAVWIVAWLLLALAAPVAIIWFSVGDLFSPGESDPAARSAPTEHPGSPQPDQALAEHRARAREWLTSYGWIDRPGGIARVPIEEGMRAVLERGLPARDEPEEDQ